MGQITHATIVLIRHTSHSISPIARIFSTGIAVAMSIPVVLIITSIMLITFIIATTMECIGMLRLLLRGGLLYTYNIRPIINLLWWQRLLLCTNFVFFYVWELQVPLVAVQLVHYCLDQL